MPRLRVNGLTVAVVPTTLVATPEPPTLTAVVVAVPRLRVVGLTSADAPATTVVEMPVSATNNAGAGLFCTTNLWNGYDVLSTCNACIASICSLTVTLLGIAGTDTISDVAPYNVSLALAIKDDVKAIFAGCESTSIGSEVESTNVETVLVPTLA